MLGRVFGTYLAKAGGKTTALSAEGSSIGIQMWLTARTRVIAVANRFGG